MRLSAFATLVASVGLYTASAQTTVTEGSTTTHRANVDNDAGEVYVYTGGSFPKGTSPNTFSFLWDIGVPGSTGYITPLLVERMPAPFYTAYNVRAIGQGFAVTVTSSRQSIPFNIVEDVKVTPNLDYTFGYVNALVNASGQEVETSRGTVDMAYPADSGRGVGPNSLNLWAATQANTVAVPLGAIIGGGLSGTDVPWVEFYPRRTYSAQVQGTVGQ